MSYEAWGEPDEAHDGCFTEEQVQEARQEERDRIVARMREAYPMNAHALEWADWIEDLCVRCGCEKLDHVPVHAGTSVSVVANLKECEGYLTPKRKDGHETE
jgi:hypothetical protein